MIQSWKGDKVVSEKPAKILAYYDVIIPKSGKISSFDITELENENKMLDYGDTIYDNLNELGLKHNTIEDIISKIIDKVRIMYFEGKETETFELKNSKTQKQ